MIIKIKKENLIAITLLIILSLIIIIMEEKPKGEKTIDPEPKYLVVSKSFNDFSILCDSDATNLQKRDVFDKEFKDRYVEWTGEVRSISESWGSYTLQVRHCGLTFTSDIIITMKDDQKDKLLQYMEGDTITYRAKLIRLGDIIGLSASEGEVIG